MSLNNNAQPKADRFISNVDTQLLSTLLNKELNAEGRVFSVKVERNVASDTWQIWVEHFRGTYTPINPETIFKHDAMVKVAKELADKLRNTIAPREEVAFKDSKKSGDKK